MRGRYGPGILDAQHLTHGRSGTDVEIESTTRRPNPPKGLVMRAYSYVLLPVIVVLGTAVILINAYLALVVLIFVAPVVLVGLAAAILFVPYLFGRYVIRKWQEQSAAVTHEHWSAERQRASAG